MKRWGESHLESWLFLSNLGHCNIAPSLEEAVPHVVAVDGGKPETAECCVVMAVVCHHMHHWEVQCECQSKPASKRILSGCAFVPLLAGLCCRDAELWSIAYWTLWGLGQSWPDHLVQATQIWHFELPGWKCWVLNSMYASKFVTITSHAHQHPSWQQLQCSMALEQIQLSQTSFSSKRCHWWAVLHHTPTVGVQAALWKASFLTRRCCQWERSWTTPQQWEWPERQGWQRTVWCNPSSWCSTGTSAWGGCHAAATSCACWTRSACPPYTTCT